MCEIDEQAQRRFEWLLMQMKQQQCITKQLKNDNSMEWVEEIILHELIYK